MKPDTARVRGLLRSRGADGLTSAEARKALGTDHLGARVWELIHEEGDDITSVRERAENGRTYSRYFLHEPVEPVQLGLLDFQPAASASPRRGRALDAERLSTAASRSG